MASVVEKTPSGIIYRAAENRDVPDMDLLTLLFESKHSMAKEDTVLHADAEDPSKCVTKSQLRTLIKRLAHTLRNDYDFGRSGFNKDVAVCIALGHYQLPAIFFSIIAAGGIYSACNPGSTPHEIASQLRQVDAKLIFCTPETKPIGVAAATLSGLPLSRVLVLGPATAPQNALSLFPAAASSTSANPIPISTKQHEWARLTSRRVLDDTVICLPFSSGTTGPPKAVMLNHTNMVSQATLVLDSMRARDPSLEFARRTLAHLPAAHVAGIQSYFVNHSYGGGTVFWMDKFDFANFLRLAKRHAITGFFSVPPIYLLIAKSPAVTDQFDSVVSAISGAAPMGRELQAAVSKKLGKGKAQFGQTWGLSETTGSMTVMVKGMENDETGSVAMLVASGQARIVDDDGRDVQPGEAGEIWVKGPQVFTGYWRNEKATKESFRDGWFCTGDVGLFRDGQFYIVDRKKELIKYNANQVAPAELEALLISHPKILDAAVIGVPGEGTEVPRAYVVADQKEITAEQIASWVAGQVANHKKLRGGVVFLPSIPKSPSGKILRKELRELAKKEAQGSKL
ncbi:putative acyl-coenzyme A synthetase [Echria macrotheca]|uniref:Acyl-coenzyme A synthetase n=1 Tax=Echria macrotheca TaxID=438768 RepID=A0AAJ0B1M0_9PEZI|nr:putative acyl-coenzyme A synthetase [Echria macrotheca]